MRILSFLCGTLAMLILLSVSDGMAVTEKAVPILIVPDDCLIGAIVDGRFVDGKTAVPRIGKHDREYRLYSQAGHVTTTTCAPPDPDPQGVMPGRAHDFVVRCAAEKSPSDAIVAVGGSLKEKYFSPWFPCAES